MALRPLGGSVTYWGLLYAVEPVVLRAHLAGGQWKRTLTAATSAARVPWVHVSVAGVNPEASRAYRLREWGLSIGDLMPQALLSRRAFTLSAAVAAASIAAPALAQQGAWPSKPIRIIVP